MAAAGGRPKPPAPLPLPFSPIPLGWAPGETKLQGPSVSSSPQALLRTLLALAAFATAIAAIHIGAYHFYHSSYWYIDWCDLSRGWDSPPPPSTPEEARREELCLFYQNMIQVGGQGSWVAQTA